MISYNSGEIGIGDFMMIRCSFSDHLEISCNLREIGIGDHIMMIKCSWEGIGYSAQLVMPTGR